VVVLNVAFLAGMLCGLLLMAVIVHRK